MSAQAPRSEGEPALHRVEPALERRGRVRRDRRALLVVGAAARGHCSRDADRERRERAPAHCPL